MEKMVMSLGPDKCIVLLLNILHPRTEVKSWVEICSKGWKGNHLLQTSDYLGGETLIELLKNYSRSHEIKKSIVGIIGANQEIQCALGFEAFVEVSWELPKGTIADGDDSCHASLPLIVAARGSKGPSESSTDSFSSSAPLLNDKLPLPLKTTHSATGGQSPSMVLASSDKGWLFERLPAH